MKLDEKRKTELLERQIRPPVVLGPNTVILSPPVGSADAYMRYLRDHAEDYRRFFRGDE